MKNCSVPFLIVFAFLYLCSYTSAAQQKQLSIEKEVNLPERFIYPVDYPVMSFSGDYGELRGNHFHGGLDFRVGGVVGAPILATADGYISKISVSPTGYGNALYITHSNGFVSVYGHLHKFADKIQQFVRKKQYEKESFVLTLELDSLQFPVKQGEKIAYAGNTGSSGGPHLHFEIRNSENVPLSVLERSYIEVHDKMSPIFNRVEFFGYFKRGDVPECFIVERGKGDGPIKVPENFYVVVDAIDKMEGTNAKLAVNEYKVYLDTTLVYDLVIGEVPFGEGKYINSLIEYSLKSRRGKSFIKSYVEPGNMLSYKIRSENDGILSLKDTLPHKVKVEVIDYKGNRAVKSWQVQRCDSLFAERYNIAPEGAHMAWYLANIYESDGFKIKIPSASLYRSIYFTADTAEKRVTPFSPVWNIHTPETPLHTPATVNIRYEGPDSLASKALLASVRKDGNLSGAGGSVEQGQLVAKLYSFGKYTIAVDVEAPSITPSFNNGAVIKGDRISFVIRDRLSGIKSYRVEIDGHWVLAEFDAKTARLRVPLPDAKITRGTMHKAKVVVVDNKDNESVVTCRFKW